MLLFSLYTGMIGVVFPSVVLECGLSIVARWVSMDLFFYLLMLIYFTIGSLCVGSVIVGVSINFVILCDFITNNFNTEQKINYNTIYTLKAHLGLLESALLRGYMSLYESVFMGG